MVIERKVLLESNKAKSREEKEKFQKGRKVQVKVQYRDGIYLTPISILFDWIHLAYLPNPLV